MSLDRWRVFDRRYSLGKFTKLWLVLNGRLGALTQEMRGRELGKQ